MSGAVKDLGRMWPKPFTLDAGSATKGDRLKSFGHPVVAGRREFAHA
jgi:hypothetical protein